MIQRIQSLYLSLVLLLLILMLFFPLVVFNDNAGILYQFMPTGLKNLSNGQWYYVNRNILTFIFILFASLINLVVIFLYKRRKLQVKLSKILMGILAGLFLFIVYEIKFGITGIIIENSKYNWTILVPIISIILIFLAVKSIKRDDELVKSIDRLR